MQHGLTCLDGGRGVGFFDGGREVGLFEMAVHYMERHLFKGKY